MFAVTERQRFDVLTCESLGTWLRDTRWGPMLFGGQVRSPTSHMPIDGPKREGQIGNDGRGEGFSVKKRRDTYAWIPHNTRDYYGDR